MDEQVGQFPSRWGMVRVIKLKYQDGALAVRLELADGEVLAMLSVNMKGSLNLPEGCFYAKDWSENVELAKQAQDSGCFVTRVDLPSARSGFVTADVWQIVEAA